MRKLRRYEHSEPYGIDKITISLPRDYLDEDQLAGLKELGGISRLVFIQCIGIRVYISFQRELFDPHKSYLEQIEAFISYFHESIGLFKFPLSKTTGEIGVQRLYKPLATSEEQFGFLMDKMGFEEIEVFFDHKEEILKYLSYSPGEVINRFGTIYSKDYKKTWKGYPQKSLVKIYTKPEAQKAHKERTSDLEYEFPIRTELTLRKEKMSYMGMGSLDCDSDEIIERLIDALAKGVHERAPWLVSIGRYPFLNETLKAILTRAPKKRLRCPRQFLECIKKMGSFNSPQGKQGTEEKGLVVGCVPLMSCEKAISWDEFISGIEGTEIEQENGTCIEKLEDVNLIDLEATTVSKDERITLPITEIKKFIHNRIGYLKGLLGSSVITTDIVLSRLLRPCLYTKGGPTATDSFVESTGPPYLNYWI